MITMLEDVTDDEIYLYRFPMGQFASLRTFVDDYIRVHGARVKALEVDECILNLLDVTTGLPPLGYVSKQLREFADQYPRHGTNYTAVLYASTPLTPFFIKIVNVLASRSRDRIRIFAPQDQAEALAWLREMRTQHTARQQATPTREIP